MDQVHIDMNKLPEYQSDALCRTVSASIRRLMNDPAMKEDYENWRRKKYHEQH